MTPDLSAHGTTKAHIALLSPAPPLTMSLRPSPLSQDFLLAIESLEKLVLWTTFGVHCISFTAAEGHSTLRLGWLWDASTSES